jgi:hypothetical protein
MDPLTSQLLWPALLCLTTHMVMFALGWFFSRYRLTALPKNGPPPSPAAAPTRRPTAPFVPPKQGG